VLPLALAYVFNACCDDGGSWRKLGLRRARCTLGELLLMRILILNQAFYPDVVSTAQHAADLAAFMAAGGDQVTVIASARGYDDPARRFAAREVWRGVRVLRVRGTAFGKAARWRRALDFATFMMACVAKIAFLPRQDVVVALTSPPLISFIAALLVPWKARSLVFWCMDLNPDEAVAAGWLKANSFAARTLNRMLGYSLRRARVIVALDRFMAQRIESKGIAAAKIVTLPPWSHDKDVIFDREGREQFRKQHGLEGKFVVMYSGNHSPCHPLDTLINAAAELHGDESVHFCFVGGGSQMQAIKRSAAARGLTNITFLPYQARERLSASLSSADFHAVVMGEAFVGIVHPCKIYNVLRLGCPVLYVGPSPSHVTEILHGYESSVPSYACRHGDVGAVVSAVQRVRGCAKDRLPSPGLSGFSYESVVPALARVIRGQYTAVTPIINPDLRNAPVGAHDERELAATAENR